MKTPFSLKDKIFLVTGASSGIGKEVAIAISKQGGRVIITGRNKERLEETYEQMENKGMHFIEVFDLENIEQISIWIIEMVRKYSLRLDGLIHCAGIIFLKPFVTLNNRELEKIMKINFNAGIELLRSIARPNISNIGSSFVMISSVSGLVGEQGAMAYCASKAALIGAAKSAALELARFKYRVNCIAPGMVKTPMLQQYKDILLDEQIALLTKKIPLGLGDPKDVANSSIFLLSDAAKWITGTTLVVDGGYTSGK